jgi:hypothetical protein
MIGTVAIADSVIPNSEKVRLLTLEYLTPAEVADLLKISRKALADLRLKRAGPAFELKARYLRGVRSNS